MRNAVRNTSVQAYHSISDLSKRQMNVFYAIDELKKACNMDIAEHLELPINSITPRTNELVQADMVEESHRDVNPKTGKRVIYWRIKQREPVQEVLL